MWENLAFHLYLRLPSAPISTNAGDAGEGLFIRARSNRMRGNGFKLEEGGFRLEVRKKCFPVRGVRHWNRLPSKAVDAPSPEHSRPG